MVFKSLVCSHGGIRKRKREEEEDGVVERERDEGKMKQKEGFGPPIWPATLERGERKFTFCVVQN